MEESREHARVRATVLTIILVAGGLGLVELDLSFGAREPTGIRILAAATLAFSASLLVPLRRVRTRLGSAVFQVCVAILFIQTVYLVVYPAAYPALAIASLVVVALALSFVTGRQLFGVALGAWAIAAAAIVWGNLGRSPFTVPATADDPILIGSGLAAVTVGMVLLWQFGTQMTNAVERATTAHTQLSAAHQKLRGLDEMKSRFINSAAHELNTPMTPVMIQLRLLKATPQPDPQQARSVEVLERNLNRINGLVHEMLDVARLQAGRLEVHRDSFAVRALLEEGVADFAQAARARGVVLSVAPTPDVRAEADRHRVAQVLSNLLSNAVRLTPSGGSVVVRGSQEGRTLTVRVMDTGIGLTAQQKEGLFQPFGRVHDDSGADAGTTAGLGLYICRGLVEEMGGRLWAESAGPGKGATFAFTLPAAPPMPGIGMALPEMGV